MCFSFKNSGKIERSLQGSSVINTHKKHRNCSEGGCGHYIAWIHHQFSDFGTNTKIHKYKYKYNLKIVKKIVNNCFAVQWHHHQMIKQVSMCFSFKNSGKIKRSLQG